MRSEHQITLEEWDNNSRIQMMTSSVSSVEAIHNNRKTIKVVSICFNLSEIYFLMSEAFY